MEKFSGNYCNTIGNFIIDNLPSKKIETNDEYNDTICVLKNILTRGNIISPSKYLCQKYNYENTKDNIKNTFLSGKSFDWINTIKGGEISNPALKFYNDFEKNFPNYKFVKELIIPETYIEEIIGESLEEVVDKRVDFYIPQAKLVIEIDGYQHNYNQDYDRKRDEILKKYGNKIVRINTKNFYDNNSIYLNQLKYIEKQFEINTQLLKYKENCKLSPTKEKLTYIYRIEIIILELLLSNYISLRDKTWNIKINVNEELLIDAYNDLKNWLIHLFEIRDIKIKFPGLNDNNDNPIYIDINIYERYETDNPIFANQNIIVCRTDYFDDKNYFKVASGKSINYKIKKNNGDSLKWLLNNIFDFPDFKDGQLPIIHNLLNLKHTIGILPTGSGKSLCYQFVSLLQPSTSIVVCPLTSLIKDQCDSMKRKGITNVRTIDSTLSIEEKNRVLKDIGEGRSLINWIAPERFQIKSFRDEIQKLASKFNITYVVIDEVHCLSEWGHDFRISYLQLVNVVKKYIPSCTLVGLTATLSMAVLNDIKREFGLAENDFENIISKNNFSRDELHFTIFNILESNKQTVYEETLKKFFPNYLSPEQNKSSLIFFPFRKGDRGCIKLSYDLQNKYVNYKEYINYFAGAKNRDDQKHNIEVQDKFINNKITALCCTKAFGMGIDKPNIRLTIHYGMSSSIDSFYQEVGRAARDGLNADNIVIHAIDAIDLKKIIKHPSFDIEKYNSFGGNSDLDDQLSLFIQGLKNPQNEEKIIYRFFNYIQNHLKKNGSILNISFNEILEITKPKGVKDIIFYCENILYKLYLLGILKDWTIDFTKQKFEIIINDFSSDKIVNKLNKYIQKSESSFDINNLDLDKYKKYYDIFYNSNLPLEEKCIKIICEWYYEKITYRKILEICNLDKVLNDYNTDEALKKYINKYYTLDDDNIKLSFILQAPKDYNAVLDLFKEGDNFISKEKCEKLEILVSRFLIESKYNDALNLLDSLLNLCLNNDSDLNNIQKSINEIEEDDVIDKLIELGMIMPKESQRKYFEVLKSKYNNFKYLNNIFKISNDRETYLDIIKIFNKRIKEIERKFGNE